MSGYPCIRTTDGTVIVRDPNTGMTASGRTVVEALAELRRLLAHTHTDARHALRRLDAKQAAA